MTIYTINQIVIFLDEYILDSITFETELNK